MGMRKYKIMMEIKVLDDGRIKTTEREKKKN